MGMQPSEARRLAHEARDRRIAQYGTAADQSRRAQQIWEENYNSRQSQNAQSFGNAQANAANAELASDMGMLVTAGIAAIGVSAARRIFGRRGKK